jgi:hypothetical protein
MGLIMSMSDSTGETHFGLYLLAGILIIIFIVILTGIRGKFTMPDPDPHDIKHNVPYENVLNVPQAQHMYCQCPGQY